VRGIIFPRWVDHFDSCTDAYPSRGLECPWISKSSLSSNSLSLSFSLSSLRKYCIFIAARLSVRPWEETIKHAQSKAVGACKLLPFPSLFPMKRNDKTFHHLRLMKEQLCLLQMHTIYHMQKHLHEHEEHVINF